MILLLRHHTIAITALDGANTDTQCNNKFVNITTKQQPARSQHNQQRSANITTFGTHTHTQISPPSSVYVFVLDYHTFTAPMQSKGPVAHSVSHLGRIGKPNRIPHWEVRRGELQLLDMGAMPAHCEDATWWPENGRSLPENLSKQMSPRHRLTIF